MQELGYTTCQETSTFEFLRGFGFIMGSIIGFMAGFNERNAGYPRFDGLVNGIVYSVICGFIGEALSPLLPFALLLFVFICILCDVRKALRFVSV